MNPLAKADLNFLGEAIKYGNLKEALTSIENKKTSKSITSEDEIRLNLLYCQIMGFKEEYDKVEQISMKLVRESKRLNQPELTLHSLNFLIEALWKKEETQKSHGYLNEAELLFYNSTNNLNAEYKQIEAYLIYNKAAIIEQKGKISESLDLMKKSVKLWENTENKLDLCKSLNQLGLLYQKQSESEKSLEHHKRSLKLYERLGNKFGIARTSFYIAKLFLMNDNLELAQKYLEESKQLYEKLNIRKILAKIYHNMAIVSWKKGELAEALAFDQKSLEINEEIGEEKEVAYSLFGIGSFYEKLGELDIALDFLFESLELHRKLENKFGTAYAMLSIGSIYQCKGEYKRTIRYLEQAVSILLEIEDKNGLSYAYYQIAKVYQLIGELDLALDYCFESLIIREEVGSIEQLADSLLLIISIYTDKNDNISKKIYLQMFDELYTQEIQNIQVEQRYLIASALVLKSSNRVKDWVRASEIFEKLIEDSIVPYDLLTLVLFNQCELLLLELKYYKDEETISELKIILNSLEKIARNQQIYSLLAESFWLQSQVALVEMDIPKAKNLLNQAQIMADSKGLYKLALRISEEHDKLISKIDLWNRYFQEDMDIHQRVILSQVEKTVEQKVKNRGFAFPTIKEEEPIILLILDSGGLTIFVEKFDTENDFTIEKEKQFLIGGFLSAINMFMNETFTSTGSIERIKYKEYTILLKAQDPLLFVYILKGQSYLALQKVDILITKLQVLPEIWRALTKRIQRGLPLTSGEYSKISTLVRGIFLSGESTLFDSQKYNVTPSIDMIKYIGKKIDAFINAGYDSVASIANAKKEDLIKIKRVGPVYADKIILDAKKLLKKS